MALNKSSLSKPVIWGLTITTLMSMSPQILLANVNSVGTSRIEINMTAQERESLLKPKRTDVKSAKMTIIKEGVETSNLEISLNTRGQTSLKKFSRKNLAVKVAKDESAKKDSADAKKDKVKIDLGEISAKEVILSASPEDLLATKNMIVYRLYKLAGIPTLKTSYAEVMLNGASEGLYMVSESPKRYLMNELDADIVLRRRYDDVMETQKVKDGISEAQAAKYNAEITELHKSIRSLTGQKLIDTLSAKLDIKEYMQWLAVNFIVQNGDYSDEVFFYGKKDATTGNMYFRIFPWDLDDSFSERMHQENIPGGINSTSQHRSSKQMLYSFESRIERAIVQDPDVLRMYFSVLEEVANKLNPAAVKQVFDKVSEKLNPYLADYEILANGLKDSTQAVHDPAVVAKIMAERQSKVNARVAMVKAELQEIKENNEDRSKKINLLKDRLGTFLLKATNFFL